MKITHVFRRARPNRRKARRQAYAIRAKIAGARRVVADSDARLVGQEGGQR